MNMQRQQDKKKAKNLTTESFSGHSSRLLKYSYLLVLIITVVIIIFLHILAFLRRHILILEKHKCEHNSARVRDQLKCL